MYLGLLKERQKESQTFISELTYTYFLACPRNTRTGTSYSLNLLSGHQRSSEVTKDIQESRGCPETAAITSADTFHLNNTKSNLTSVLGGGGEKNG